MKARVMCDGKLFAAEKELPDGVGVGTKIEWEHFEGLERREVFVTHVKSIKEVQSDDGVTHEIDLMMTSEDSVRNLISGVFNYAREKLL